MNSFLIALYIITYQTFSNVRLNVNRISIAEFNNDDVTAINSD
ncbi:hypothetical protein [Clostridium lacusfryxellense]|nr:hypothetical protein [Clostridium lacusfryxellense]